MNILFRKRKSFLSLMQLMSANLPLGGFSNSRGLEFAVECGWVHSRETFSNWQKQWIYGQLVYLEWPMMKRCYYYAKNNNSVKFKQCAIKILSYRDTYELRLDEQLRGKSMSKLILQWFHPVDKNWILAFNYSGLSALTWLGCAWGISLEKLALGYAYNMLESSITVGLKLTLFGQMIAQQLLRYLSDIVIETWSRCDDITNDKLGNSFPLQSIASICHETQYSRLFRS